MPHHHLLLPPREELLDTSEGQTRDRLSYYVVSIPGEAAWISDHHSKAVVDTAASTSAANPLKRSLEDGEEMETEMEVAEGEVEAKLSACFYKSDGRPFWCLLDIIPIKNELAEVKH